MKAADLNLVGQAARVAAELELHHPRVIFTSGLRSLEDQARAMAQNVAQVRTWIAQTYRTSSMRYALQAWVTAHPSAVSVAQIRAGLLGVLRTFDPAMLRSLSRHLTGEAFDVQPGDDEIEFWLEAKAQAIPGAKFLTREGGLRRAHFQC